MYSVFMAQWRKDKRNPLTIILFIVLSILATIIFGDTAKLTQTSVAIFSNEPNGKEIEKKWATLLNNSDEMEFVITEEEKAREAVVEGRRDVAIQLMEKDYRLITSSDMPTIQLVEQHVHKVFIKEAQLEAVVGTKNTDKLRNKVKSYLENPPLKVQTQSLSGGEIAKHNMGMQLLFAFTLFSAMFTIGFKVNGITADKASGIWNRLILSPVSKTAMYTGHLLYSFCIGFLQMLIVLWIFQYGFDYELGNFQMILVIAAVYTLSMVSLAMLFTSFVRTPEQFNGIYTSVIPIIPVISGVYMPPGTLDNPILRFISDLFPLTHAVDAMMDISLFDASWNDIALPASIMLLIGVVCMGIGVNLAERGKR
ncbi:ABC transporter permease [Risungbinella massiliensis]|uniref:ABC transporter permease n=1 Tax=Risungbinella massiliensis TaxID=1329796 RepID=UPI0005CB98CD|nr:ABC transporter permease [Risungbinella massiliensis]